MDDELLYLNGSFMPLSEGRIGVEDRGFQLGDGVYEVIKVLNGRLVWVDDHLERLRHNVDTLRIVGALERHPLERVLPDLVGRSGVTEGMVYVQVTRGTANREYVFPDPPHPTVLAYTRSRGLPEVREIMAGMVLHPLADQRWARSDIKSTNLLASVLAKEEAYEAGADEALLLGPEGVVREGGSSNIFAVLAGVLRTHPLDSRILGGITRKYVLEAARRLGYTAEERAFTLAEVIEAGTGASAGGASEVFVASTLRDIQAVVRIGTHAIGDGRPGAMTLTLLDAIRREQAVSVGLPPPAALASQGPR
jgi:D-alanine transaminase